MITPHSLLARRVADPTPPGPGVIAITGGKGGIGKTLISVNLAVALADCGQKILLIDGNLALANVDLLLGLEPLQHVGAVIDGSQDFDDVVIHASPGLDILPAAVAIGSLAELEPADQICLLNTLALHWGPYDLILIDTAPGIGINVRMALSITTDVLVLLTPEITSLTNAYALIKVCRSLGGSAPIHVLVNRVTSAEQARELFINLEQTTRYFLHTDLDMLGYVYQDRSVEHSIHVQTPLVRSAPQTMAARCIHSLAGRIASMYTKTNCEEHAS